MVSTNQKARWTSKRLPPNKHATRSAKAAASKAIGHNSRQDGARPASQEQQHSEHTQAPDHQSQNRRHQHQRQPSGQVLDIGRQSTPAAEPQATGTTSTASESPDRSPGGRPHNQRQGAARGTRSGASQRVVSAFEWEALKLERQPKPPVPVFFPAGNGEKSKRSSADAMSRNRPRGPPLLRDNGQAANEETDMWNKILQDLRKAQEKNDKQKSLAEQISALNEKIGKEGGGSKFILLCSVLHEMEFGIVCKAVATEKPCISVCGF